LRLERVLELAEVQGDVLGEFGFAAAASGGYRGHQHALGEFDGEEVGLLAGGVGDVQPGVLEAAAGTAGVEQRVGTAVHVLGEGDVLHVCLAAAGRTRAGMQVTGVAHSPRPRQDRNVALVHLVVGCPLDLDLALAGCRVPVATVPLMPRRRCLAFPSMRDGFPTSFRRAGATACTGRARNRQCIVRPWPPTATATRAAATR